MDTSFERESTRLSGVQQNPGAGDEFNKEAYPGKNFPAEAEDVRCLLCQQPVEAEARTRLEKFIAHITSDTEAKLAAGREKLGLRRKELVDISFDFFGEDSAQRRTIPPPQGFVGHPISG